MLSSKTIPSSLTNGWGAGRITLLIALLYLVYLPLSGYDSLPKDAGYYWDLAGDFSRRGHFSLLNYADSLRGYLYPLTLFGPWAAHQLFPELASAVTWARVVGVGWAAIGFGLLGPALWQAAAGPGAAAPSGWRRVAFAGLGFVFWRDYANFTLSDFPALWALAMSLWVLLRFRSWPALVLAGACMAAACNARPVYLVAVPFVWAVQLALAQPAGAAVRRALGTGGLWLGASAVLWPQLLINQHHFGENSPLVLARMEGLNTHSLYLEKLNWGLEQQKYETSIGTDYPAPVMLFRDEAGTRLLREASVAYFPSYSSYLRALLQHPLSTIGLLARRLFNGLDVQYPTPYIKRVYQPTWALAGLNYTVWFGAILVLGRTQWRKWPRARWFLLAGLLAPCLAVLPLGIECRYLLPLHLLLYATLAFGWPSGWTWHAVQALPAWRRGVLVVGYVVFLGLCFAASAAAQATLEFGPRAIF